MKRLIIPFIALLAIACSGPSKSDLQKNNDSLATENAEKDKQINDLASTLLTIDKNLLEIKEKENLIKISMSSPEGTPEDIQKKINDNIQDIYNLMLANKEQIANLEKSLSNVNSKNSKLNTLVKNLNRQLKDKSVEIIELREQLNSKNIEIASLNFTVEGMSQVIDSIRTANLDKQAKLDATTDELYTAYYAFGTKKELKEHKVISKEGLPVIGKQKVLSKEFNEDYFTKVDIREVETIPLFRSKFKLLTNHPEDSYEVLSDDEDIKTIKILNKDTFWSVSKFMVAQVN